MRNAHQWTPSWCVVRNGTFCVSHDPRELGVGSRLAAGLGLETWYKWIAEYARGRLVDLGCGKVPFYQAYRLHTEECVCVDWEGATHGTQFADYLCDLNEALPFAEGEFDTVILSSVLEHVARPEVLWEELSRIVNDGGYVLVSVPFLYWIHEAPHDYYRYTEYALRRFCERNGFCVLEFRAVGGAPEVVFDVVSKVAALLPRVGPRLAASLQSAGICAVKRAPLAKLSRKTADRFPLAYMFVAQRAK